MNEELEELERILAEKVEDEEGWSELEIGEVKLIYVGKLKESVIQSDAGSKG